MCQILQILLFGFVNEVFLKFRLSSLSILLLATWLPVEVLFGFWGYVLGAGQSDALAGYRAICGVLLLLIPFLAGGVKRSQLVTLAPCLALTFVFIVQLMFASEQPFFYGLRYVYKVSFPFIALFTIIWLADIGKMKVSTIKTITAMNATFLLVNLSLVFFDIGHANYGSWGGALQSGSGFLYAGNEVAVTLIAIFGLTVVLMRRAGFYFLLILAGFGLGAVALNTKAALIGFVCIALAKIVFSIRRLWLMTFASLVVAALFWSDLSSWFQGAFATLLSRWSWFTSEYGIDTVLLGGAKRLGKISEQSAELLANPTSILIGNGWSGETENNFFDLIYAFGLVGAAIFLLWCLIGPSHYFRFLGRVPHSQLVLCSLTLVLIAAVALVSGHAMQSASLSVFWALLVAFPYVSHAQRRLHNDTSPRRIGLIQPSRTEESHDHSLGFVARVMT